MRRNRTMTKDKDILEKVLEVKRVLKTNAGGKVVSFSAFVVSGNKNGKVGLGFGKAKEVPDAVEKAKRSARKNMITLDINRLDKLPHNVNLKYCGTRVIMKQGNKGLIANNIAKNIFRAAGLKNVVCKVLGARSLKNTAYGILEAISDKHMHSLSFIAKRRGLTIDELLERKRIVVLSNQNQTPNN